jgi:hypothetical protein
MKSMDDWIAAAGFAFLGDDERGFFQQPARAYPPLMESKANKP